MDLISRYIDSLSQLEKEFFCCCNISTYYHELLGTVNKLILFDYLLSIYRDKNKIINVNISNYRDNKSIYRDNKSIYRDNKSAKLNYKFEYS